MNNIVLITPFARSLVVTCICCLFMTTTACGLRACTEMGCVDQATIIIRRTDGRAAPVAVQFNVEGRRITCPMAALGHEEQCSDPHVRHAYVEVTTCEEQRQENIVSCEFRGTGQFEQRIMINKTPHQVTVSVHDGGQQVAERVLTLAYQAWQPNGRGCDPVCRQAVERWELP